MDKSRYVDNGYPDMQTLASLHYVIGVPRMKESDHSNIWYSIIYRQHCMWYRATETWAAAGLLSLARRKTTSCGNGWLETMRRHV